MKGKTVVFGSALIVIFVMLSYVPQSAARDQLQTVTIETTTEGREPGAVAALTNVRAFIEAPNSEVYWFCPSWFSQLLLWLRRLIFLFCRLASTDPIYQLYCRLLWFLYYIFLFFRCPFIG